MTWYISVSYWLAHAAVGGFLLLSAGCLAVWVCRQPVRRLRLIEVTLIGCLLLPLVYRLPGLPQWSMGLLTVPQTDREVPPTGTGEPAMIAEANGSLATPLVV